jgi:flagellar biosynthesis protein FlhF
MKIKQYKARDMRQALQQIRAEQGPDAVILSTQEVDGGVEVCAADDYEQARAMTSRLAMGKRGQSAASTDQLLREAIKAQVGAGQEAGSEPQSQSRPQPTQRVTAAMPAPPPAPLASESPQRMGAELRSLRELLERQLAALTWNDFTRRDPARAHALDELIALGVPRDDAWKLLQSVPAAALADVGSRTHLDALALALSVGELDPLLESPLVLVGPTGAGKSTLLAKLAVRAVVETAAPQVGIITLDTQRLGAGDQSRGIGRLLGVDTVVIGSPAELCRQLSAWSVKRRILIDTAGFQPRDTQALEQLTVLLKSDTRLRSLVVLPASAQLELLDCCLTRLGTLQPSGVVLTRVDEALSLGGALTALLRHALPLLAVSDGPRVPEDLQPARRAELVARAASLIENRDQDGGAEHAAA